MNTLKNNPKQDRANIRIPPPVIPLIAIIAGWLLHKLMPLPISILAPYHKLIGWFICGVSVAVLGFWSVFTFRSNGETENPFKATHRVLQRGPYRFTRNPMYLMMVLICCGAAFLQSNLWHLVLVPVVAWMLYRFAIRHEEQYLEAKFGEEYLKYKQRVRRWI